MTIPATNSALEVANWFFNHAQKNRVLLENANLQHLLFLSQVHFALSNHQEYLMPSIFVCDDDGFSEANMNKILDFGMPLMPPPNLSHKVSGFLDLIWKKYGAMSLRELNTLVKNSQCYIDNYISGYQNVVDLSEMSNKFKNSLFVSGKNKPVANSQKKVLLSQNGPVVVSKWQPRKVNTANLQGE